MNKTLPILIILFSLMGCTTAVAQTQSLDELEILVAPIALYPDDLIAIILPAATNPIQLIEANYFLDWRKTNRRLRLNEEWDDPIKALLNYPEIIQKLNDDLDWTNALGEEVLLDEDAVLDAIQSFRRKTQALGHLKSDDKQIVVIEREMIYIRPANPQVFYIPRYNYRSMLMYDTAYDWDYWPNRYPVYYYRYPADSVLIALLIWGAAITSNWDHDYHYLQYGERNAITTFTQRNRFRATRWDSRWNGTNTNIRAPLSTQPLRDTQSVQPLNRSLPSSETQPLSNDRVLTPVENAPVQSDRQRDARGRSTETRPMPRPETRPMPRPETRPVPRPETRPMPRPETRPMPRPETRPMPRPESRPMPRPETRPMPRPETRPMPRPESRPTPRPETRPMPRPETRPAPRPETRPKPRPQTVPQPNIESRSIITPGKVPETQLNTQPDASKPLTTDIKEGVAPIEGIQN
jgi:hypothetical protein